MKKSELKKVLKPLIKECIKEVIFEEGVLSDLISEVMRGTSAGPREVQKRIESKRPVAKQEKRPVEEKTKIKLKETKQKMLNAIGRDSFNGVDLFEGTDPMRKAGVPGQSAQASPLEAYAPDNAGVDISSFFSTKWKEMV